MNNINSNFGPNGVSPSQNTPIEGANNIKIAWQGKTIEIPSHLSHLQSLAKQVFLDIQKQDQDIDDRLAYNFSTPTQPINEQTIEFYLKETARINNLAIDYNKKFFPNGDGFKIRSLGDRVVELHSRLLNELKTASSDRKEEIRSAIDKIKMFKMTLETVQYERAKQQIISNLEEKSNSDQEYKY